MIRTVFFDLGGTLVVSADRTWIPGARETLAAFRARGLRLGIISNTGTLSRGQLADHLPPDFDWAEFADPLIILSGEVGVEKPDPAIFRLAVDRTGGPAAECLFCTEELPHALAAQGVGMCGARVQPPPTSDIGDLPAALAAAGLLP